MIFRIKRTQNYTILSNVMLRDMRISLKAKGLLCQLMSHATSYEISIRKLQKQNIEGKDAIMSAINELIEARYIVRKPARSKGRYQFEYIISDEPIKGGLSTDSPVRVSRIGLSASDNPHTQEVLKDKKKTIKVSKVVKVVNQRKLELEIKIGTDDDGFFDLEVERIKKKASSDPKIKNKIPYIIQSVKNIEKSDLEIRREKKEDDLQVEDIKKAEKLFRSLNKKDRVKEIEEVFEVLDPYFQQYKDFCMMDGKIIGNDNLKRQFYIKYAKKAATNTNG